MAAPKNKCSDKFCKIYTKAVTICRETVYWISHIIHVRLAYYLRGKKVRYWKDEKEDLFYYIP